MHPLSLATGQQGIESVLQVAGIGSGHHPGYDLAIDRRAGVVRDSPQRHHFLHRVGKVEQGQLWQVGQLPRQAPALPLAVPPAAQQQLATGQGYIPGDQPQQRGFAGAVGAGEAENLAGRQRQADVLQQWRTPGRRAGVIEHQYIHDCMP